MTSKNHLVKKLQTIISEILTAVRLKTAVICNMACSVVNKYRHFGRKYRIYYRNLKTATGGSFAAWVYIYKIT